MKRPGIEDQIINFTVGLGVDAVIIAAATDSTDPINFAGAITRKKGRVVILGAVPPYLNVIHTGTKKNWN